MITALHEVMQYDNFDEKTFEKNSKKISKE